MGGIQLTENKNQQRKTALVLSGGGARGAYEIGVWQALRELGIQIDMVFGTSVGAINGTMIVQNKFEEAVDLWHILDTTMVFDIADDHLFNYVKEILDGGADTTGLRKLVRKYVNENAIRNSPVEFGIVTTEFPSLTPLYLTKEQIPPGKLHDYILASAACFPAVRHHKIGRKKYIDGGYYDNLPVKMALESGATHVIAVNLEAPGIIHTEDLEHTQRLKLIESCWNLGNVLVFDQNNSSRIMRLGYLDTMKSYGLYEGNYYTFVKGEFPTDFIEAADTAARLFDLPAEILYLKSVFDRKLKHALIESNTSLFHPTQLALALSGQLNKGAHWQSTIQKLFLPLLKKTAPLLFPKQLLAAKYLHHLT